MYKKHLAILIASFMVSGCLATYGGKDPSSNNGQLISYQYEFEGKKLHTKYNLFKKCNKCNFQYLIINMMIFNFIRIIIL
jgi:hypothetical protein